MYRLFAFIRIFARLVVNNWFCGMINAKENIQTIAKLSCETCMDKDIEALMAGKENNSLFREFFFPDFAITYGNLYQMHDRLIDFKTKEASVKMVFQFCGSRVLKIEGFQEQVEMSCNSQTLLFTTTNKGQIHFVGCESQRFLEVNFKPEFLLKYLPNEPAFISFHKDIKAKQNSKIADQNGSVTVPMQTIIDAIFNSDRQDGLQHLFLESKIKELLLLQLESYSKAPHQDAAIIQKYHADKIYQAKAIIEANVGKPCSLIDLAHQVGTNECTLKKGFRALLDTSVHNYWSDLKMKKALQMLQESDAGIADIAMDTGFKTPQHFSTAFKKYYGITPGKVRSEAHLSHRIPQ